VRSTDRAGLIPKLRPLYCRVPSRGFSRTPWHTRAYPPVSVCGTDPRRSSSQSFLDTALAPIGLVLRLTLRSDGTSDQTYSRNARELRRCVNCGSTAGRAGIFTCCPSATPHVVARTHLRAASPWDDLRCPGNLGFTVGKVLTSLCATYASILTSLRSSPTHVVTFTAAGNAPLPPDARQRKS